MKKSIFLKIRLISLTFFYPVWRIFYHSGPRHFKTLLKVATSDFDHFQHRCTFLGNIKIKPDVNWKEKKAWKTSEKLINWKLLDHFKTIIFFLNKKISRAKTTLERTRFCDGKKGGNFKTSMRFTETHSFLYCLSSRHDEKSVQCVWLKVITL